MSGCLFGVGGAWVDDFSLLEVGCVSSMEGRTWGGSVVVNPLGSLRLKFCHKLVQRVGRDGKGVSFRVWSWFKVCQLSKSSSCL